MKKTVKAIANKSLKILLSVIVITGITDFIRPTPGVWFAGYTEEFYDNGQKSVHYRRNPLIYGGNISGIYTEWYENGNVKFEGKYIDGNLNGQVITWYENGSKNTARIYKDGQLNGLTTIWDESGSKTFELHYEKGAKKKTISFYEDGATKSEIFEYDEISDCKSWYSNGTLKAVFNYKNEKLDGPFTSWYQNGYKNDEGFFLEGEYHGSFKSWWPSGKNKTRQTWIKGNLLDSISWKPNGVMCQESKVQNGNGIIIDYNNEGQAKKRNKFINGINQDK